MKSLHKIIVACSNSKGSGDMFVCEVNASEDQVNNGDHYDMAKNLAEDSGYEAPFVCFDHSEHCNVARIVSDLNCPIPFVLHDDAKENSKESSVAGSIDFGHDGLWFKVSGYSDCSSSDDGYIAKLECFDGAVNLRSYADINSEGPTSNICFDGAKVENYIDDVAVL
jgi:hypothetical protein